ncbi:podocan-like [Styela clava]
MMKCSSIKFCQKSKCIISWKIPVFIDVVLLTTTFLLSAGSSCGYSCYEVCTCNIYFGSEIDCKATGMVRLPNLISYQQAARTTVLDFGWNDLTFLPDKAFSNLPLLQRVLFNSNYLDFVHQGIFNSSGIDYSPVQYVDFSDNHIYMIPQCFQQMNEYSTKLDNLTDLNLGRNEIGPNIEEYAFNGVRFLESLDLSHNSIQTTEPRTFKYMRYLNYLDLRFNYIESLPSSLFGRSSGLKTLRLTGNKLTVLPGGIPATLTLLELGENRILNLTITDAQKLHNLPNIEMLNFSRNGLREIVPNAFQTMSVLEVLDLSNNAIHFLNSDTFAGADNLEYLFLNRNPFLRTLPKDIFVNLTKLRFLFLYGCALKTLEFGTPSISPLSVSFTSSVTSDTVHVDPLYAPNLEAMWLFGNPINCDCLILPLVWFINVRNLTLDANLYDLPRNIADDAILKNYLTHDGAYASDVATTGSFCTTPFNRHSAVVGKQFLSVPERDLICPNQPFFVAVSMFLGIVLFAAAIPVVFFIVFLYLCTVRVLCKKLGLSLSEDED